MGADGPGPRARAGARGRGSASQFGRAGSPNLYASTGTNWHLIGTSIRSGSPPPLPTQPKKTSICAASQEGSATGLEPATAWTTASDHFSSPGGDAIPGDDQLKRV